MSAGQFIVCNSSDCKICLVKIFFSSLLNNASVREVLKRTLNIYVAQGEIPHSSWGVTAEEPLPEPQEKLHFVLVKAVLALGTAALAQLRLWGAELCVLSIL